MTFHLPCKHLDFAIQSGKHLVPIVEAVRDFCCRLALLPQHFGPLDPPAPGIPTIIVLGDDLDEALGPAAFDERSLRRSLKGVRLAAVVSCEPLPEILADAARHAVLLRKNVVIIETQSEQEIPWLNLIREIAPEAALQVGSVKGGEA